VKRLGAWFGTALLAVVTLAATAYVLPSLLGYERYVITGGSMDGTYDKGSIVLERAVPAADLRVGDVITYQPPASSGVSTLVTHRIVRIGHDAAGRQVLRTKGDANPDPDPWRFSLESEQQPVVTASVPYAGHVMIALADRHTRMAIVGIPAAIVALISLVQLIGALRERPASPVGRVAGVTGP